MTFWFIAIAPCAAVTNTDDSWPAQTAIKAIIAEDADGTPNLNSETNSDAAVVAPEIPMIISKAFSFTGQKSESQTLPHSTLETSKPYSFSRLGKSAGYGRLSRSLS
jgi:hypothetical protein